MLFNSKFGLQLLFSLLVGSGMEMFFALFLMWQGVWDIICNKVLYILISVQHTLNTKLK